MLWPLFRGTPARGTPTRGIGRMIAADGRRATGFAPSGPGGRLGERGLLRHRSRLGGGEIAVDEIAVGIVKVHLDGAQRGQHADTVRQAAPPPPPPESRPAPQI